MNIPDLSSLGKVNSSTIWATAAMGVIGCCVYALMGTPDEGPAIPRSSIRKVKRAISGHKIKIKPHDYLMYAGIYAPDIDDPIGRQALERNTELLNPRKVRVRLEEESKDNDGRLVGYVFANGEMVNRKLVSEGLAYVRLKRSTHRFADELLAAQREARAARRGLWKAPIESTENEYPGDLKHGVFHRPTCKSVANTRPGNEIIFTDKTAAFDAGFAPCKRCNP